MPFGIDRLFYAVRCSGHRLHLLSVIFLPPLLQKPRPVGNDCPPPVPGASPPLLLLGGVSGRLLGACVRLTATPRPACSSTLALCATPRRSAPVAGHSIHTTHTQHSADTTRSGDRPRAVCAAVCPRCSSHLTQCSLSPLPLGLRHGGEYIPSRAGAHGGPGGDGRGAARPRLIPRLKWRLFAPYSPPVCAVQLVEIV